MSTRSSGVHAVERAADVLLAFTSGEGPLGISELARALEMPKSAVHRSVNSLVKSGLLARDSASRRYKLGPGAVQLGLVALGTADVLTRAHPILTELTASTSETAALSLRVGMERMYVAQVEGPQVIRMKAELGRRHPIYLGASGKAILAGLEQQELEDYLQDLVPVRLTPATITDLDALRRDLDEVRARGYAVSLGERDRWTASVAAPVRGTGGRIVGSVAVCGPIARFTADAVPTFAAPVLRAAHDLTQELE
jgi:DNA-binding IclR family transcriptional regulator